MLPEKLFDRPIEQTPLYKTHKNLCDKYDELSATDIKKALGLSELEIVDQQLGLRSILLKADFLPLINSLSSLGYTLTSLYNNAVVQECKGFYMATVYENTISILVSNAKEVEVSVLLNNWHSVYAVRELSESGYRYSLQIFGEDGRVIQKIFMQPQSNFYAYQTIIANHEYYALEATPKLKRPASDSYSDENDRGMDIDVRALILDWRKKQSINHAELLVKKYGVSYQQMYRCIGDVYAEEFSAKKLQTIMEQVTQRNILVTFRTSNKGALQDYTGMLSNVYAKGDHLYCIAADFSLRILETAIANAWLVRKATAGGIVTSLEFYGSCGSQLLKIHGEYDAKYGEGIYWKRLAEGVLQYCSSGYLIGSNKSNEAYMTREPLVNLG